MNQNNQKPEKTVLKSANQRDGVLQVHSIWNTIQGEGPFAGRPAVFIRLAGCNLQCPGCDTEYTSNRDMMTSLQIGRKVMELRPPKTFRSFNLVTITGGEPFRQGNLAMLVSHLKGLGYTVQIETNCTIYPGEDFPYQDCCIIGSPKGAVPAELWPHLDAVKYVVRVGIPYDHITGLPKAVLGRGIPVAFPPENYIGTIYIQPEDSGAGDVNDTESFNRDNLLLAADICYSKGYTLSVQLHKILGVK